MIRQHPWAIAVILICMAILVFIIAFSETEDG
jgi:hypothetical protein